VIPRATVAAALDLPADTDALPEGDLPVDRLARRMLDAMARPDTDETNLWTLDLFHHLCRSAPDLALDTVLAMLDAAPDSAAEIGAGPLTDLMTASGAEVIDRIEGDDRPALTDALREVDATTFEHPFLRARIEAAQG